MGKKTRSIVSIKVVSINFQMGKDKRKNYEVCQNAKIWHLRHYIKVYVQSTLK